MNPILLVKKSDGALYPASLNADDYVQSLKTGQAIEIKPTKQAARSLRHHRLYWGGLIALAMQYWEPSGGLVAECD